MKNVNIHDNLPSRELREFFGKQYSNEDGSDWTINFLEKQIQELQTRLLVAQQQRAVNLLMAQQQWSYWDVSDEIEDYSSHTYVPFVGTEEEYNALVSMLSKNG